MGADRVPSRAPVRRYAMRYVDELVLGGGRYLRSRYRRRGSTFSFPAPMTGDARRAPGGTFPDNPDTLFPGVDSMTEGALRRDVPRTRRSSLSRTVLRSPVPCTFRGPSTPTFAAPPAGLPARGRAGEETPSICTLPRAHPGPSRAPFRMLSEYSSRHVERYPSRYAVREYSADVHDVPLDGIPGALRGVLRPYLSKKFSHPPTGRSVLPWYEAPDLPQDRVLRLPAAGPADHHRPLHGVRYVLGGLLAHLDRPRALNSPPANDSRGLRRSPPAYGALAAALDLAGLPPRGPREDLDHRLDHLGGLGA